MSLAIAMKKEDVTHKGIITQVGPHTLTIMTSDDCKCDGCAVAVMCNGKDKESELITIETSDAYRFQNGDHVVVTATSSSTLLATWWALILPTVIFVGLILGFRIGYPEIGGWSIAIGFAGLGLYDLCLFLFRKGLANKIKWKVEKE